MKILICINSAWNFYNFRSNLIKTLIKNGHEVFAVAPKDKYVSKVEELGCHFIDFNIDSKGKNPLVDALLFVRFLILFIRIKPDVYLGFTIKPNIYGSMAAHLLKIPVINNIAGLGTIFNSTNLISILVLILYKLALTKSFMVFFQNTQDQKRFVSSKIVNQNKTERLPGSGIDLIKFRYKPLDLTNKKISFLLISRMIWEKGIGEYVAAANILRKEIKDVEFNLLGFLDVNNPSAISREQVDQWSASGVVNYLGDTEDVRNYIEASTVIVLPSYYKEGVPRSLLEAAAIGRPIITTNTDGCRDVVNDQVSGLLCQSKDILDLTNKMRILLEKKATQLVSMGYEGRKKVEREFDVTIVVNQYLKLLEKLS